jgi:hypothetical protein
MKLKKNQQENKYKQVWQIIIHTNRAINNTTFGIANSFVQKIKNKNKLHLLVAIQN